MRSEPTWLIRSNAESGKGFSDILVEPEDPDAGIVIEVKYAPTFRGLEQACARAMEQIKARRYDERLREDGREDILAYGIAFNKKRCKAVCEGEAVGCSKIKARAVFQAPVGVIRPAFFSCK